DLRASSTWPAPWRRRSALRIGSRSGRRRRSAGRARCRAWSARRSLAGGVQGGPSVPPRAAIPTDRRAVPAHVARLVGVALLALLAQALEHRLAHSQERAGVGLLLLEHLDRRVDDHELLEPVDAVELVAVRSKLGVCRRVPDSDARASERKRDELDLPAGAVVEDQVFKRHDARHGDQRPERVLVALAEDAASNVEPLAAQDRARQLVLDSKQVLEVVGQVVGVVVIGDSDQRALAHALREGRVELVVELADRVVDVLRELGIGDEAERRVIALAMGLLAHLSAKAGERDVAGHGSPHCPSSLSDSSSPPSSSLSYSWHQSSSAASRDSASSALMASRTDCAACFRPSSPEEAWSPWWPPISRRARWPGARAAMVTAP